MIQLSWKFGIHGWIHNNFMRKNYILDDLDNTPYNVYSSIMRGKTLWKALNWKY